MKPLLWWLVLLCVFAYSVYAIRRDGGVLP